MLMIKHLLSTKLSNLAVLLVTTALLCGFMVMFKYNNHSSWLRIGKGCVVWFTYNNYNVHSDLRGAFFKHFIETTRKWSQRHFVVLKMDRSQNVRFSLCPEEILQLLYCVETKQTKWKKGVRMLGRYKSWLLFPSFSSPEEKKNYNPHKWKDLLQGYCIILH